ncbi:Dehydrogenase protein [Salinisphaera shabanensis E1L3A]|uniref:Dehydrogenase protein n=1 Tax=Salinisphaera shabanensis E1L3A TaxID=1033802 RepID=U2EQE0_9GAMM|nr:xanthine dehydrogenase family protein molybdopterin-binding subunit [Salinisphaera shabanensis]ERJ19995.1 Dehydrogenase protein [Salinisphaera shabanensis E1L3A]
MSEFVPITAPARQRQQASIGQPVKRRDGVAKVTGAATYAADNHPKDMLHAVMAVATIANGRVRALDVAAAKAHPGVVEVMTPENRPALAKNPDDRDNPFMFRLDLLQSDRVRYANQPIAVVIAETFEAATEGAALLAPRYDVEPAQLDMHADSEAFVPEAVGPGAPAESHVGDIDAGLAQGSHRVDSTYETPAQYHNPMEPHAVVAAWEGDKLIVDTPSQAMTIARGRLAGLFGIDADDVLIRSPYLGGGFGCKGALMSPQVLGILAAKMVGRPVKLVPTRPQMYGPLGHRAPTSQTLRLGMDDAGKLTALSHHARTTSSMFDEFFEPSANISHTLYASLAISTTHDAVRVHTGTPMFMRGPGEASGSVALESAIDEAAHACGMDPLAFRLANYADVEPISGKPFSSKRLYDCYAQGAERFGWAKRVLAPRSMRDENGLLVGWGLGTATFPVIMFEAEARAIIRADGTGVMETGAQDMGQGAWTALAQIAADSLKLELDQTVFRAGTSDLPDGGVAGGSGHTATVGNAIDAAGRNAIARLIDMAVADTDSPLHGLAADQVEARWGRLQAVDDGARSEGYADILRRAGLRELEGHGRGRADADVGERYAMHAHGAVFAEVKVDPDLGQMRVTRMVGAFAAGRVINPRMVESQFFGGMIWGLGFALHEKAETDPRTGRIMNANLGEYHVPTNADVANIEALIVNEDDPHVNVLGIKGVGEIAVTGTAGAIANAVWHATSKRVRRFPIGVADMIAEPATAD